MRGLVIRRRPLDVRDAYAVVVGVRLARLSLRILQRKPRAWCGKCRRSFARRTTW